MHAQKHDSNHKLCALDAPEAECLVKGKARTLHEFGVKASVAVTAAQGPVVGMCSMLGNPDDGNTMDSQPEQVSMLMGHVPKIVLANRGYRSVAPSSEARLLVSHTRRLPMDLSVNNINGQDDLAQSDDGSGGVVECQEGVLQFFVSHQKLPELVEQPVVGFDATAADLLVRNMLILIGSRLRSATCGM